MKYSWRCLPAMTREGRNVSDKPTSPQLRARPTSAKRERPRACARTTLKLQCGDCSQPGKIRVEDYGKPSRPYTRLVVSKGDFR